jgi:hypothetical protein
MTPPQPQLLDAALQCLDKLIERSAKHPDPEVNDQIHNELRKLREEIIKISNHSRGRRYVQTIINLAAIVRYLNDHWPGT